MVEAIALHLRNLEARIQYLEQSSTSSTFPSMIVPLLSPLSISKPTLIVVSKLVALSVNISSIEINIDEFSSRIDQVVIKIRGLQIEFLAQMIT